MLTGRRRFRLRPTHRLLAAGCAALILLLTILAASPELHQRFHHETQPDRDDGCAVVLFSLGITGAAAAAILVVVAQCLAEKVVTAPAGVDLTAPRFQHPPGCGPPAV